MNQPVAVRAALKARLDSWPIARNTSARIPWRDTSYVMHRVVVVALTSGCRGVRQLRLRLFPCLLVHPVPACCSDVVAITSSWRGAGSASAQPERTVVRSSVVEEAREIGGRVYHPHALALLGRSQDFQMHLQAVDAAELTVGLLEYASPVRIRTQALQDAYQVNFPLQGRIKMAYGEREVITSPVLAGIHGPEQETSVEGWERPARMLGLKIPQAFLERELEILLDRAPERAVEFTGILNLDTRQAQEWRSAVELLAQGLRTKESILSNPLVAGPAAQAVVRGLLLVAPNNYTAELTGDVSAVGPGYVRQAVEFLEDNAHRPLTVEAIAAAVHVSPRSLQMGFREHLGSTPMAVLRDVRLHRVREELLQAPPSARVAEVAARWGFAQAGRFAVQYAKTFGESPSDTLRRSSNR